MVSMVDTEVQSITGGYVMALEMSMRYNGTIIVGRTQVGYLCDGYTDEMDDLVSDWSTGARFQELLENAESVVSVA